MIAAPMAAWNYRGQWHYEDENFLTHCWADGESQDDEDLLAILETDEPVTFRCGKPGGEPLGLCAQHREEILG